MTRLQLSLNLLTGCWKVLPMPSDGLSGLAPGRILSLIPEACLRSMGGRPQVLCAKLLAAWDLLALLWRTGSRASDPAFPEALA